MRVSRQLVAPHGRAGFEYKTNKGGKMAKAIAARAMERLRALDPADPQTASALVEVVGALDATEITPADAAAIYAEVDRITREINRAVHKH